jgi:hypothetical protein
MARAAQVMWVRRYLPDVASDFSVFHRVDDTGRLPARTFFALAARLPFYDGVVRARAVAEAREREDEAPAPAMPPQALAGPQQVVGGSKAELQSEPMFAGMFSFGSAGG